MSKAISAIASRISGKYLAQLALVCAAQFAAGKVGDALQTVNDGGIGPVWPASGIALAALLLWGYAVWPGVAAGAFLLAYLSPLPHGAALLYAAGTTLAAALGTFLLHRIVKFNSSLSRLRDALGLIILGAFASSLVSASIGASILYGSLRSWSGLGSAWLVYWLGDSTGVLLVAPVALTFPNILRTRDRNRATELALLLALLIIGGFIVFGDFPLIPTKLHILTFAVLPFVMWAAVRLGVGATALSIFVVGAVATVETALGSGPFTTNTPMMNAVLLDVFFVIVSVTGLTFASVIAEREQAEGERERLIRERAEAEARLRFAAIVESSDDAIISGTLDGIITSWNAGAERIYGYTEAEAVGKPITLLVPFELPDEEKKILETLRAGGRIESFETIRVTKAGKRINVSLTISPIKDSSGRTVGISGIARDITERKRVENAVKESEQRFRLLADTAPVLIWLSGTDKLCTYFNKSWLDFTGRSIEQEHGNGWTEGVYPDDLQGCLDTYTRSFDRREEFKMEYRLRYHDGEYRWIFDIGVPRFNQDGSFAGYIGSVVDITERKRAEEALRESEEKFRTVFRDAGVGMVVVSPEGRFLATNSRFCDILGYTEEELLAKTVESITFPEDWIFFSQKLQETLTYGRGFQWFEKRCLHKSGRIIYTETSASLIQDRNGEPQYFVGEVLDITDRKKAEEALLAVNRRLIEAQEQERARIGRELHDDINQRLAMLTIELEQLLDNPSEVKRRVQELRKKTSELSGDVQALSHELHSSKLEYLGAVGGMKSWCKEFAERQKIEIDFTTLDAPSRLPPEIGLCLFRVLQEALQNAVKHSGVRRIEVQLGEESGEIHLVIRDSGRGFDVETAKQGRGLGLTSMRERVRLVNGAITFDSKPMLGTTIHVNVPLISESDFARAAG